ncbi:phage baseplate assembly protein [Trabulsiella guamensis ATCC 49490]|uniref:Phage baseplate assembly protein n=1 Tax=Trabulsiella guamensis ATCC 49490 TaxID=1005994 RepID=A0A085ASD8_9ENTR|nr:GPW/gp25 family protein [Trabulsiella guamensis]KFC13133.1 phage baseplate assembly protein [Trabulsiella guamensis ATCC 49490]
MIGINAETGRYLSGNEHLQQSVKDILLTPKGTRVLQREYGSDLLKLVDRPQDARLRLQIIRETATALGLWEPRIRLTGVQVSWVQEGVFMVTLTGVNKETNEQIRLEGIAIGKTIAGDH